MEMIKTNSAIIGIEIIGMNIPGASTKVSTGHFTRAQRGRGITSLCSTDYD